MTGNDTSLFFSTLFGALPEGALITIWTLPDKRSARFRDGASAGFYARRRAADCDVYVAVGLQGLDLGPQRRGEASDVIGLVGLWADIDYADPVHKRPGLPPDAEAARDLVMSLPLAPTMMVHSGHGLQAWWAFAEPWMFDNEEDRSHAARIARGWQRRLADAGAARKWSLDSTHDLARVLRVPGTLNRKGKEPVPVRLLDV